MIYHDKWFEDDPEACKALKVLDLIKFDDKSFLIIGFEPNGKPILIEAGRPNQEAKQ